MKHFKPLLEDLAYDMGKKKEDEKRKQLSMNLGEFAQRVEQFSALGKKLYESGDFLKLAKEINEIAENAEAYIMKEGNVDWFDGITVKRNMKELKNYVNEFVKVATEAQRLNQRMTALYEDSGRVLGRYFEIQEAIEGGGDLAKSHSEEEKQLGLPDQPSMKMEGGPGSGVKGHKTASPTKQEKSKRDLYQLYKTLKDNGVVESIIKEDVNDDYPGEDWVVLDVPKLKYEQAKAFESALKKEGYKVLRKDWKERQGYQTEFAEFFVPLAEYNEANEWAVKNYKDYDVSE